jgi:hypothetical protein
MKPFIFRYSEPHSMHAKEEFTPVEYCCKNESCIISDKPGLAIDYQGLNVRATGSLTTDAKGDPSLDESTDR